MTEISKLPPRERAKRYRELAKEAQVMAASAMGAEKISLIKIAGHWEQLAREAEAEAEGKEK
jgi:hypothetical protein